MHARDETTDVAAGPGALVRRMCAFAACIAVTAGVAAGARAETCPAIEGGSPALEAASAEERLAFLRRELRAEHRDMRRWKMGWGIGFGGLAVVQFGAGFFVPDDSQPDFFVGAGRSAIASISFAVFPDPRVYQPRGEGTTCEDVAEAEKALLKTLRSEKKGRGWLKWVGSAALNLANLAILGFKYDRWLTGSLSTVVGLGVGVVVILRQPYGTGMLRRYRAGELAARDGGDDVSWAVAPIAAERGAGVGFVISF